MTVFTPEWRVKINGFTVTDSTLVDLTITSGRQTIYEQASASYANLTLITSPDNSFPYQINDSVTVEIRDSAGSYVSLFGGFVTDIAIIVQYAGTIDVHQEVRIVGVGALARLVRANFTGNLSADRDGNQMYELLSTVLFNTWQDIPAALTWDTYEATTIWSDAENSGLGEIDTPGDYDLAARSNLNASVYEIASSIANSGLGYLYEDSQGRIGYADSTRRGQYLVTNGYTNLDANQAQGTGLRIIKRSGDVRNSISVIYGASQNSSVSNEDATSIALFGQLATTIDTYLQNQSDAESQSAFYLSLRAYPQYEFDRISFPLHNPEISDAVRDELINVFMGQPVNIKNLPANMTLGQFQGFVEGWTWRAGVKGLSLDLTLSPLAYSIQTFQWDDVPGTESWNTLSATLDWLNATIVA